MKRKEQVELIHSIRTRTDLKDSAIHAILIDILEVSGLTMTECDHAISSSFGVADNINNS